MIASSALDDSDRRGELRLGDILAAAGVDAAEAVVLRHTHKADGLRGPEDLVPERLLEYTRRQGLSNKLGRSPARLWLVFIAEQGLRSRLLCAYDNHGEVLAERDSAYRYFNLALSDVLSALNDRLVINWSRDPVN